VGRKSLGAINTGAPFMSTSVTLYRQLPRFNLDFTQGSNYMSNCPSVPTSTGGYMQQTQSFATVNVTAATMPATLAPNTACYDASAEILLFEMVETEPVADEPSPLGDCPGAVACTPYAAALGTSSYRLSGYTLPYPSGISRLAYKSSATAVSLLNATNSLAAMFPDIEDTNEASLCQ
jgi:hypothetical protein